MESVPQEIQTTDRRQRFFKSFEAKSLRSRSFLTRVADDLTAICCSTSFLVFHVFLFSGWILINTNLIPEVPPFDPFPFGLLTMVVSLEAIFLSIFVLVSQNRSSYISTIRDEVQLRVNLIAEEEITKVLQLLDEMRSKMGITKEDPELVRMLQRTNTSYIEKSIEEQLSTANRPIMQDLKDEIRKPLDKVHSFTQEVRAEEEKIKEAIKKD